MANQPQVMRWRDLKSAARAVVVLSGTHQRSIPVHAHDFWELQLGERGFAEHETADGRQSFRRGTVVLLRPGAWHEKRACAGLVSWACCFPGELIGTDLHSVAVDPQCGALLHHPGAAWSTQLDEATTRKSLACFSAAQKGSRITQIAQLSLVLDLVAQTGAGSLSRGTNPEVLRVLDAIDAQPSKPWSVTGAARQAGLSITHFSRCCRTLTGQGPLMYVTLRRLEQATRLLLAGGMSISEIAVASGFADAAYFTRCFRRHRGDAPRQWLLRKGCDEKNRRRN